MSFPPGQAPDVGHEFNDAVRQMMWEWDSHYWYWVNKFHPIEDEL